MSETRDEDEFMAQLSRVERRGLPAEWRDEVLENAGGVERRGVIRSMWASVPKAVALPVAAAWVAVAVLRATMPGGGGVGEAGVVQHEPAQVVERETFVSWIVEKRRLGDGELSLGIENTEGQEL